MSELVGVRIELSANRQPVFFIFSSFLVCIRGIRLQRVVALLGCIGGRAFLF